MKIDIEKQLELIEQILDWTNKYKESALPIMNTLKTYRRRLNKIKYALEENCSAAAYGESQVGKSYLMSSLLSSANKPLSISVGNKEYSFIDEINPSGSSNTKRESTGIITRFTINCENPSMKEYIKIRTLSIVDIILFLSDSYYKDVKIDTKKSLSLNNINELLENLLEKIVNISHEQYYVTEDDIVDIQDYFRLSIGNQASSVIHSDFFSRLSDNIKHIRVDNWGKVFALLWNKNDEISNLFSHLINEYSKLEFVGEAYIPFEAVLREKHTLLDISWIDTIFEEKNNSITNNYITVYNLKGKILCENFLKSYLSVLTAELYFILPDDILENKSRSFLKQLDLLDFPGARRRESIHEENIGAELGKILKRGKVSYLFNKYSDSLRINTLLFCQHNDQNSESEIGETINKWITENIGRTAEERTKHIINTNNISPFFLIATKFNIELKWTNEKSEKKELLIKRWEDRFDKLKEEVIKTNTYKWFDNWIIAKENINELNSNFFRSIYLLRDFFWSRDQHIYEGYKEGISKESREIVPPNYKNYRIDLRESFLNFSFVKKHFLNPSIAWEESAGLNKDGSMPIICSLNKIAPQLDEARRTKYQEEIISIKDSILNIIEEFYIPDDPQLKIESVKRISGGLRMNLDFSFGKDSSTFGNIVNFLMINPTEIRDIITKILKNYTEVPQEISVINIIRAKAGINPSAKYEENKKLLCKYYHSDYESIKRELSKENITIEDIIRNTAEISTTKADIIVSRIIDYWENYLSQISIRKINEYVYPADNIIIMLKNLFDILGMKQTILEKVEDYLENYDIDFAPNVIADSISLLLNDFSSSLGYSFMKEKDIVEIKNKSKNFQFEINIDNKKSIQVSDSLSEIFSALDNSANILKKQNINENDIRVLRKIPLYDNFWNWEYYLQMGLILTSDIPNCNPEANTIIGDIINKNKKLQFSKR
jgi:hypothetical protein